MPKRANSENRQRYLAAAKRGKHMEAHGKGSIPSGSRGFLFSHAMNREKDSMREAFNWLKRYANEFDVVMPTVAVEGSDEADDDEEEDIAAALSREAKAVVAERTGAQLFRQFNTKCKNILYVEMSSLVAITPMEFTRRALVAMREAGTSQARHLMRVMPVHTTVETTKKNVEKALFEIVQQYFPDASSESPRTYCCQLKARNNSTIDRQFVFDTATNFVRNRDPFAKVDLTNGRYIIDVQVLGNVSCVSVYEQFFELKKYNLHTICQATETEPSAEITKEAPTIKEAKDTEKE